MTLYDSTVSISRGTKFSLCKSPEHVIPFDKLVCTNDAPVKWTVTKKQYINVMAPPPPMEGYVQKQKLSYVGVFYFYNFFPQFNQAAALYRINSCTSPACANRKSYYNRFCCFSLLSFETKQLVACILRKLRSWFHSLMMKLFLNYSLSVRCSFEDSGFQEGSADKPLLYNCFKRDLLHWWLATCS